jgi:hypothetical protein
MAQNPAFPPKDTRAGGAKTIDKHQMKQERTQHYDKHRERILAQG